MPEWAWVLIVIAVIAVIAIAVWMAVRNKNRQRDDLRDRFGPEYDETVARAGNRGKAEAQLRERAERRESYDIRPLPREDRVRFAEQWRSTQARFVDQPSLAVDEADVLVKQVMSARGYPTGDVERQTEDVSVDHPDVVGHYRAATRIAASSRDGQASTEDLRQAMVHYRALFAELLSDDAPERRSA
jgi:hypothetical protein